MFIIYDIVFFIFVILYLPYFIIKRKWHDGLLMRFGCFSENLKIRLSQRKNIWIHAVSVGEVLAVSGLVKELRKSFPGHRIVFSTTTKTGHALAAAKLSKDDVLIWSPLDFSFAVNAFVRCIKPELYIVAETEIWPNLWTALKKKNVSIVVVNGRISDGTFGRYKKIKFILNSIIKNVRFFCVQSQPDQERVKVLGAKPERVRVVGNVKFDGIPNLDKISDEKSLFGNGTSLFIAGSTHPGEEQIVLEVFERIRSKFPDLRLVIAPRHVERSQEIVNIIELKGLVPIKFSENNSGSLAQEYVIVVDTIGHLRGLYSLARIVFVGKSLVGKGGQNIIEPASFGKPVLVGPNTQNFRDVVDLFLKDNAIIQVHDEKEFFAKVDELLSNPKNMERIGACAKRVVQSNQGATRKTLEIIKKVFDEAK